MTNATAKMNTDTRSVDRAVFATTAGETTTGSISVIEFSHRDRRRRALLVAIKSLGVTALCIFIPGAHFVLVPLGLFVVTPLLAVLTWRVTTKILSANVLCPKCSSPVVVLTSQERYPLEENCGACHRPISIRQAT